MRITAGIDVGSTYTKAIVLDSENRILGRRLEPTGFKLDEVAENVLAQALAEAGVERSEVEYIVSTGFGRHQMASADTQVTDLTASARGASRGTHSPGSTASSTGPRPRCSSSSTPATSSCTNSGASGR